MEDPVGYWQRFSKRQQNTRLAREKIRIHQGEETERH